MGWFTLAVIVGFLSYWSWRFHLEREPPPANSEPAKELVNRLLTHAARPNELFVRVLMTVFVRWLPMTVLVIVVITVVVRVLLGTFNSSYLFDQFVNAIDHGLVARLLLGLTLGFGIAYLLEGRLRILEGRLSVLEKRLNARVAAGDVPGQNPDAATADDESSSNILRKGMNILSAIGLAIVFIALAAPHLDHWLANLTSVKLPFAELQVASVTAQPGIAADQISVYSDTTSIDTLSKYGDKIRQDLEYIKVEIEEMEKSKFGVPPSELDANRKLAGSIASLSPSFDEIISPSANCLKDALDSGMSTESVRQLLRPMANALEQIFLGGLEGTELDQKHEEFWLELTHTPGAIAPFIKDKDKKDKCTGISKRWYPLSLNEPKNPSFLRLENYKDVSYLYTAALLFTIFMKDERLSLKILSEASKRTDMTKDYAYLYWATHISINQGGTVNVVISYMNEMRETARSHRATIRAVKERCGRSIEFTALSDPLSLPIPGSVAISPRDPCSQGRRHKIQQLADREGKVELLAMNNYAYYVAEGLARGEKGAQAYQGIAENFAGELLHAVEHPDPDVRPEADDRYNFLDTYAYVSMVLEARKPAPDHDKIRRLVKIFEEVVEYFEGKDNKPGSVEPSNVYQRTIARTHLASALQMAQR